MKPEPVNIKIKEHTVTLENGTEKTYRFKHCPKCWTIQEKRVNYCSECGVRLGGWE